MSSFKGPLKELPNILIDNFMLHDSHTCFFLSHCHCDHMNDLEKLLLILPKKSNQFLYCSSISRLILLKKYGAYENVIKELNVPQMISVPEKDSSPSYQVTVTPIPAGHCAGSIMFLFETVNKTILYTGDFRIVKDDVSKFKPLHSNNQVKVIDKIYLDSTFLNEIFWNFPLRSSLIGQLMRIIKNWLSKGSCYHVLLQTSAQFGYEFVFVELASRLNCKIHVKKEIYDVFWNIPEIGCALTKDCQSTNIHAYSKFDSLKCSPSEDKKHLLLVRLSAMWYKSSKEDIKEEIQENIEEQKVAVCYSTHSSCSELIEFLTYLKPKSVKACVVPVGSTKENVKAYTRLIVSAWLNDEEEESSEPEKPNFPLEKNYKFKLKIPSHENMSFEDCHNEWFSLNKQSIQDK